MRNQNINGINVIEKSNIQKQSILVTSVCISRIKDFNEKSNFIKTFPKACINDFPVLLDENTERIEKTCNTDIVFVDDNESCSFALDTISKERGLSVDTLYESR
ncbi:MAG: hypothetical protein LE168_02380 [Endomicrobium sp.]|nr:hypothetical protein [Endomicrobium sp.]